jgi:hypothetical protein
MAGVAQLVRALGCGSRGRRFNSGHSPHDFISYDKINVKISARTLAIWFCMAKIAFYPIAKVSHKINKFMD